MASAMTFIRVRINLPPTEWSKLSGSLSDRPSRVKPYLIPLPDGVFSALKALWTAQDEPKAGLLFRNQNGEPLEPVMLHRDYKKHLKVPGLPDIRLHDARHTAATLLINQGVPLNEISKMLGHSSIHITHDIYAHLELRRIRETATVMDTLLNAKKPDPGGQDDGTVLGWGKVG
jgi:integrase